MSQCRIADNTCKDQDAQNHFRMDMLRNAVSILNEACSKVVGAPNYMHWPLLFAGDPETTAIECFLIDQTSTTNLLGVVNGFVAFTDSAGVRHRVTYSTENSEYTVTSVPHVEVQPPS